MSKLLPSQGNQAAAAARKAPTIASNPQFQPYSILRAIWKQKLPALAVWIVVSVITVFVVLRLPRTYQAEASVFVGETSLSKDMVASTVSTDMSDRMERIHQRVLSRDFLMNLMETYHLHEGDRKSMPPERVIEYMKDEIDMKLERGWGPSQPNTFRVSVQGKDPDAVAKVANYLATYFISENKVQRENQAGAATDFFDERMAEAKKQVEQAEARLNVFKTTYAGELPQQQDALLATLGQARTQLQGVQDALSRSAQTRLLLNNSLDLARNEETATRRLIEQAAASRKRAPTGVPTAGAAPVAGLTESQRLEGQLTALRQRYGERHPDVRRLKTQLDEARAREAAEPKPAPVNAQASTPAPVDNLPEETVIDGPERTLRQSLTEQHNRVETFKAQILVAQQDEAKLNAERLRVIADIGTIEGRMRNLPLREQEMAAVMREYEMGKTNYQSMVDKKLAADLSQQMEQNKAGASFRMLDPARVPEEPIKPKRSLLAMGGSVFGLLLGLAVAVAMEMKKQVVLGEWELPPGTPVLGRVIELQNDGRSQQRQVRLDDRRPDSGPVKKRALGA